MFEYQAIPGADPKQASASGLPFPAFGFPSAEAVCRSGARDRTGTGQSSGPGRPQCAGIQFRQRRRCLDSHRAESGKLRPHGPALWARRCTGAAALRGSWRPRGACLSRTRTTTRITVIDAKTAAVEAEIPIRIPGLERYRGVLPIGMAYHEKSGRLLVAEAGINAVGVIDVEAAARGGAHSGGMVSHTGRGRSGHGVCGQRARVRTGSECAARAGAARLGLDFSAARRRRSGCQDGIRDGRQRLPPKPAGGAPAAGRHQACGADRQGESHLR